ncbi:MAG: NUDIX hydrolase [Gammaproteobacteria bacterium]|nr:NUDIX hydrolase [Gammaproteobacteria bacterium]
MKYCSNCASEVEFIVPEGDNRPRHVCSACGAIHYQNPRIVAGCLPEWEDKILLCRRAIEPRYGLWTLPAGFMENGETTLQAACRETVEEANAHVTLKGLYTIFNLPHINQVYLIFRGALQDLEFGPGAESLDVRLFEEEVIPWDKIAFPVIRETLALYYRDRRTGDFSLRSGDIVRTNGDIRRYRITIHGD